MSAKDPTVSVIVPGYNHGAYLPEALDSLSAQSFPDWELLYVDDGSRDGSLAIAEHFAHEHSARASVLTHPGGENRGIVATYQLGIARARAPYTAFLESDDLWSPGYLLEKVRAFAAHPELSAAFSPCRVLTHGTYGRDMALRQRFLHARLPANQPFCNFRPLLRKNNVATFSAFVARTAPLQALQVPDDDRLAFYDWWVLAHLALDGPFFRDTKSRAIWRHHTASMLGGQTIDVHKTMLLGFFELLYESLAARVGSADAERRRSFERMRAALPEFRAFYTNPSRATFLPFFRKQRYWATESAASHWVNARKFAAGGGRPDAGRRTG